MKKDFDGIIIEPPQAATAAVIWLHGLGASGDDFADIIPQLQLPVQHTIRFIFPHAPVRPITINRGMLMRAWYDIELPHVEHKEDKAGITASRQQIDGFIQDQHQQGIAYNRIVLAGFSQGGAMSLYTGLRHSQSLAGLLCLSAYLPLVSTTKAEASQAGLSTPIMIAHGREDSIVSFTYALDTRQRLEHLGYTLDWHPYSMDHTVCDQEITDIALWLKKVFNTT